MSDDMESIKIALSNQGVEISNLKSQVSQLQIRVDNLESKVSELSGKLDLLLAQSNTTVMLMKYVITPLLIIVGALVGIKLSIP